MNTIPILNGVFGAVMLIRETVAAVKVNEKQCQRLKERVDAIFAALRFMKDNNLQRAELEKSLMNFRNCVEQCDKFLRQFKDGTTWYSKVFNKQNFKEEFEEWNQRLSQCAIDLNLGINLKQVFDLQQDKSDQQKDLNAIQFKLNEIASMMVQQQKQQFDHYKGIEKNINERLSSFKRHLEKNIIRANDPARAQKIAEEENAFLHIPYHDLLQEQQIGQGGFGDIYRGRWLSHDHEVAIKIIRIQYLGEQIKEEFIKEISTMYRIRYDHLLNIFGVCMEEGKYAFVVEYMSLGSLYNVLKQQQTIQLTWPDRWSIAQQMTKGINYLHLLPKPIIHRDIKSLNILMTRRDRGFLVKVGDFGLAKIRHETSRQSSPNLSIGTLAWKAPELLRMGRHTEASDVYALGIVFWELATGCEPYEDADESTISEFVRRGDRLDIPTNIPSSFAELISSASSHEPQQRPTCQQLLRSMKSAIDAEVVEPASAIAPSPPEPIRRLLEPNKEHELTGPKPTSPQPVYPKLQNPQYQNAELEKFIAENKDETKLHLTSKNLTNEDMEIVAYYALQENQILIVFTLHWRTDLIYLSNIGRGNARNCALQDNFCQFAYQHEKCIDKC